MSHQVLVHYDWLAAPTGKMEGEQRSELLSYHRSIELEVRSLSIYSLYTLYILYI